MPRSKKGRRPASPTEGAIETSDQEYKVGPGRPPREHQFKPGQSGNPKGAKRKPRSILEDFKQLFELALSKPIKLKEGQRERIMTKAEVGMEQLANQYAKGDRHARRDVYWLADKLGVSLVPNEQASDESLPPAYEAMLMTWVEKQYDKKLPQERVFAPPKLLDDDGEH